MWEIILKLLLKITTKIHIKKDSNTAGVYSMHFIWVAGICRHRICDFKHTDEVLCWSTLEISKSIHSCHVSPYFGILANSFAEISDKDFRTAMTNITFYSQWSKRWIYRTHKLNYFSFKNSLQVFVMSLTSLFPPPPSHEPRTNLFSPNSFRAAVPSSLKSSLPQVFQMYFQKSPAFFTFLSY